MFRAFTWSHRVRILAFFFLTLRPRLHWLCIAAKSYHLTTLSCRYFLAKLVEIYFVLDSRTRDYSLYILTMYAIHISNNNIICAVVRSTQMFSDYDVPLPSKLPCSLGSAEDETNDCGIVVQSSRERAATTALAPDLLPSTATDRAIIHTTQSRTLAASQSPSSTFSANWNQNSSHQTEQLIWKDRRQHRITRAASRTQHTNTEAL